MIAMTKKTHGPIDKEGSRAASKLTTSNKEVSNQGNNNNKISLFSKIQNCLASLKPKRSRSLLFQMKAKCL